MNPTFPGCPFDKIAVTNSGDLCLSSDNIESLIEENHDHWNHHFSVIGIRAEHKSPATFQPDLMRLSREAREDILGPKSHL